MQDNKFKYFYNDILSWHKLSTDESVWGTPDHIELGFQLVQEEFNETVKAYQEQDYVGILDGICDTFVTAVHLTHTVGDVGNTQYEDVSLVMPLRRFVHVAGPIIENRCRLKVPTLMAALCTTMDYTNLPVKEGLAEVCRSNWSKYPSLADLKDQYGDNIEGGLKAASDWIETNYNCENVTGQVIGDRCVFKSDYNGFRKIRKPWCYSEPNLKPILDKYWENN